MGFPILACLLAGLASAAASIGAPEQPENFFCGTGEPGQDLVQFHRQLNLNLDQNQNRRSLQHRAPFYEDDDNFRTERLKWKPVTVPVYHHILYSKIVHPLMAPKNLRTQMQVLNDAFKPAGFQFELKDARAYNDTYNDTKWATNATAREEPEGMHDTLRNGDYGTLNVYWIEEGHGFASYPIPAWRDGLPRDYWVHDGVVLPSAYAVGNLLPGWTLGKALVHVVGHWNGLLHTSSDNCTDHGDYISDTPAALVTRGGCDVTLDTCPDQPGLDPVHNYMSESDNECMTEFTPGQINVMQSMWQNYRAAQRSTSLLRLRPAIRTHNTP